MLRINIDRAIFYAHGGIWGLESLCTVEKHALCLTSPNHNRQQHIRPFVLGGVECATAVKTHAITTLKNHKYFSASQLSPCAPSTSVVAADLLSGLWGEISPLK